MITSVAESSWYYSDSEEIKFKGSLVEVKEGPGEGKTYYEAYDDFCDVRNTEYYDDYCMMIDNLGSVGNNYIGATSISGFSILIMGIVTFLYVFNTKCLWVNFVSSCCSCFCQCLGYLAVLGVANIGDNCEELVDSAETPTLCGDTGFHIAESAAYLLFIFWVPYNIILTIALINDQKIMRPPAQMTQFSQPQYAEPADPTNPAPNPLAAPAAAPVYYQPYSYQNTQYAPIDPTQNQDNSLYQNSHYPLQHPNIIYDSGYNAYNSSNSGNFGYGSPRGFGPGDFGPGDCGGAGGCGGD
eukprot:CAMPEP_0202425428 /NCGR_PEP_ID=MMETSP1345-20130828/95_1 /ASSEMBLY_ACC=CAM_ASM_000843 /TAXON_ID=342563 /ORGANISM="Fabrea Fabrea salina" /LENGTH=297 /DNA_ID=CAMNT_0049035661 /DNA_START=77 /DNA_END=970 /DNA_ORIENTATION=-